MMGVPVAGITAQGPMGPITHVEWLPETSTLRWGGGAPGAVQVGTPDPRFVRWLERLAFPLLIYRGVTIGGSWELSPGRATPRGWRRSRPSAIDTIRGGVAGAEDALGLVLTGRLDSPADVDWVRTALLHEENPEAEPVQPSARSVLIVRTQELRRG